LIDLNQEPTLPARRYLRAADARRLVKGREAEIVRALGIDWNGRSDHIRCPYPGHDDRDPSWRLMPDGRAVCSCRGPHSVFDVIAELEGCDFETAKVRAVELIGAMPAKPKANGHHHSRESDDEKKAREIAFIKQHCIPARGTLVETYLASRRLDLPDNCPDLLFHANLTDWDEKRGRPAMVAIVRRPDTGKETGGVWRTYLADDGCGKADMPQPKMGLGPAAGGVVQLMSMTADGTLGIGEGVETSIAGAKIFSVPALAALSAGGMRGFIFPRGLTRLLIFADRGPDGESAAAELCQRALAAGIDAWFVLPLGDDDFADDLMSRRECCAADYQPTRPIEQAEAAQATGAVEPEILPPVRTVDQILAEARLLTRDPTPVMMDRLNGALRHVAEARLNPANTDMVLNEIKRCSGTGIVSLRDSLKAIRQQVRGAIKPVATSEAAQLCRRYVYVKAVGAFWDRLTRSTLARDSVRYAHWAEMPPDDENGGPSDPLDVMLKGTFGMTADRVDNITFMPGSPEIFDEDGVKHLNVWTPPDIAPVAGDVSPFVEHLRYVLDDDAAAIGYMLNFFAHLVQKPWIKIKSAPLIIGKPGIGKSIMGEMIAALIGRRNTTSIEESDLRSPFNEWIDGKLLVIVNELMTFARMETMNRLKGYITDLQLRINRKNVSTYDYENRTNFLMFSNHEDAAKIEKGDRRYFVWISQAEPRDGDYYTDLCRWFTGGGDSALMHFLSTHDLSGFDSNAKPPMTVAKQTIIDLSRSGIEAYLQDAFDARQAPFHHDLVVINEVLEFLLDTKKLKITHTVLSKFLRDVGAVKLGQKRLEATQDSRRLSFWALRDVERHAKVPDGQFGLVYRDSVARPLASAVKNEIFQRLPPAT